MLDAPKGPHGDVQGLIRASTPGTTFSMTTIPSNVNWPLEFYVNAHYG